MTDYVQRFVTAADATRLGLREYRPVGDHVASRLPVVCLPGLTRNARDFHQLALFLSRHPTAPHRVIAIDYRGRGTSERPVDKATYNVMTEAQDVLTCLADLNIARAAFIGTSRGGLILHILAGLAPDKIDAILFNDIGPELGVEGLRQIQDYLRQTPVLADWDAAARHLKTLHGSHFPLLEDRDWLDYAHATYVEGYGALVADCDRAIAESFAAMEMAAPLPALWQQFDQIPDVPVMVIRGENSRLLEISTVDEMKKRRPLLKVIEAKGQGHAPVLHLDKLPRTIEAFLTGSR